MEILTVKNLSFRYAMNEAPTLKDLSFSVSEGEWVVICGATGSGKSTLLRLLKRELAPVGEMQGEILFEDRPLESLPARRSAQEIGYVMQQPEQQIVTDKVWHELAFGPENMGVPSGEIRRRVAEMASYFGMEELFLRDTGSLSGGQKQLLNLASVMVTGPSVLLLDEPTAQLDPIAAADFIATLDKLRRELSLTIVLIEHRLEEVLPLCDRLLVLENGSLLTYAPPKQAVAALAGREALLLSMPCAVRLYHELPPSSETGEPPLDIREGRAFLRENYRNGTDSLPEETKRAEKEKALSFDHVCFRYEKSGKDILSDLSFHVSQGECFCILGGNGAGKSTALSVAAGLLKPYGGTVRLFGKKWKAYASESPYGRELAYLPQDVTVAFSRNTVREELVGFGVATEAFPYDLTPLLDRHPYDLSGGERQLTALAMVTAKNPRVILLDEPTKGLDAHAKAAVIGVLRALRDRGAAVVCVTHDVEFAAELADRVALFFRGELISTDTPRRFFSGNRFYTTPVSRMTRGFFGNAVTVDDAVRLCLANGRREGAR